MALLPDSLTLLAGFPRSWFAWRKLIPLLAGTYKIIAPDLPGQGDSDRPAASYDTRSLAITVHGLLRQLGIGHYFLAAHDVAVARKLIIFLQPSLEKGSMDIGRTSALDPPSA